METLGSVVWHELLRSAMWLKLLRYVMWLELHRLMEALKYGPIVWIMFFMGLFVQVSILPGPSGGFEHRARILV